MSTNYIPLERRCHSCDCEVGRLMFSVDFKLTE